MLELLLESEKAEDDPEAADVAGCNVDSGTVEAVVTSTVDCTLVDGGTV